MRTLEGRKYLRECIKRLVDDIEFVTKAVPDTVSVWDGVGRINVPLSISDKKQLIENGVLFLNVNDKTVELRMNP